MNHSQDTAYTLNNYQVKLQRSDAGLLINAEDAAFRRFSVCIASDGVQCSTSGVFEDIEFMHARLAEALEGMNPSLKIDITDGGKLTYSEEEVCRNLKRVHKFTVVMTEEVMEETDRLNKRFDAESKKTRLLEARVAKLEEENQRLTRDFGKKMEELRFSLLYARIPKSQIVKEADDIKLLREWIGSDNVQFRRLFQASKDGFDAKIFHQKCDEFQSTLVIIKSEHKRVFGGYTDQTWSGNGGYKTSRKTWIYSLDAREKYKVKGGRSSYAIFCHPDYFPTFGGGGAGEAEEEVRLDLCLPSNCNMNNSSFSDYGNAYQMKEGMTYGSTEARNHLAGSYEFKVEEIEVFHVLVE